MRALPRSHTRSTQWTDDSLESVHSNEWCTGEDSNLRTSQGGADLQSAGFNHSPTCAEMPVTRLSTFPAAFARIATCARRVCACSKKSNWYGESAQLLLRLIHRNWKSFLMECR